MFLIIYFHVIVSIIVTEFFCVIVIYKIFWPKITITCTFNNFTEFGNALEQNHCYT